MVPPLKDDDGSNWTSDASHTTPAPTKPAATSMTTESPNYDVKAPIFPRVRFSHVQLYVDHLHSLETYKNLERNLQEFWNDINDGTLSLEERRQLWSEISQRNGGNDSVEPFTPQKRDIIKQMMTGFGMRVTGMHKGSGTTSFLVTTKDLKGVQVVVTAKDLDSEVVVVEDFHHFQAENIDRFFESQHGRQGISVLGFQVDDVDAVHARYQELHKRLIHFYGQSGTAKILEVYAYYCDKPDGARTMTDEERQPDTGTLLRFIETEKADDTQNFCILPGLQTIPALFDNWSKPAYFDHWVSNVFSRTEFLHTLNDTLGFEPKVDFNAGVVAAGEAQIESTVTGNESTLETSDKGVILQDQSQVYLPINNALSPVGHVHGFLEEIGQGIQHIANRVEDLVEFVSRCNEMRETTGEGFSFLNIPRSYYGVLSSKHLQSAGISNELADSVVKTCCDKGVAALDGAVDLEMSKETLLAILDSRFGSSPFQREYQQNREVLVEAILKSRYCNLYSLLKHHISETTYLDLVKNQILCDVQDQDVLYQIFTCKILFKEPADEAPFFEFIQRVCSQCESNGDCPVKVKAGCGGFGIRNFLTLFLSIEVSKAMRDVADAKVAGDESRAILAQKRVDCFTNQLNESNPVLTEISDAMTEEGTCLAKMKDAQSKGDAEAFDLWKARKNDAERKKEEGNKRLMECSHRYELLMRSLRESSTT